jgi:hypothetical protein
MSGHNSEGGNDFLRHKLSIDEEDNDEYALNNPTVYAKPSSNSIGITSVDKGSDGDIQGVQEQ